MAGRKITVSFAKIILERVRVFCLILVVRIQIADPAAQALLQDMQGFAADIFFWQGKTGYKNLVRVDTVEFQPLSHPLVRDQIFDARFFRLERRPGAAYIRIRADAVNVAVVPVLFGKKSDSKK